MSEQQAMRMLRFKTRDKHWWKIFEVAPAEVRAAMNRAMAIRDEMRRGKALGVISAPGVHEQRLDKAEALQWAVLWHWWTENPDAPGAWRVHGTREERRAAGNTDHEPQLPEPEPIDLDDV